MRDSNTTIKDTPLPLEAHFRKADWLWKQTRLRQMLQKAGLLCAVLSFILLISVLINEQNIRYFPLLFGISLGIFLILLSASLLWPVSINGLIRKLDFLCDSKDTTMAAWQLKSWQQDDFWDRRIMQQSEKILQETPWPARWPLQWSRYTWSTLTVFLLLYMVLVGFYIYWPALEGETVPPGPTRAHTADALNFMRAMNESPEGIDEKAWKEMEDPVRELARQLLAEQTEEEMILMSLNRLEDKISAMQQRLRSESIEELSDDIASALEPVKGSADAAQKIREKKFKDSAEALKKMAEKVQKDKSGESLVKDPQQSAEALKELAKKLEKRGNEGMQQAMDQISEGAQGNNQEQVSDGLEKMSQEMQKESMRQQQSSSLREKQSMLDQMKQNMQQGQNSMEGMKQPGQEKQPGQQWGMGSDDNPFSEKSALEANLEQIKVAGEMGEGQSKLSREKAASGSPAETSGEKSITFEQYQNLSQQTVEDESIPLSHRSVIQDYFQRIRPASGESDSD